MSDWWLGQLARQDQYGDTPPANWPVSQMPEQPDERDAFEAAALRTRAPYRNLPAPGSNRLGQLAEQITSMPSWADVATQQMNKDKEAFQTGGIGSLLGDTSVTQDLAGGFGGTTKAVGKPVIGELASPFYSAAGRAVENAKLGKGTADQWLGYLRNQPGVKPEELQYVFGNLPEGQLTKAQMQAHAAQNAVTLGEVNKGGGEFRKFGTPEEQAAATQRVETARQQISDLTSGTPQWHDAVREYNEAQAAMRDVVPGWGRAEGNGTFQVGGDTKYSQWQLPGGENYRETLLTLPGKQSPAQEAVSALDQQLKQKYGQTYYHQLSPEEKMQIDMLRDKANREIREPVSEFKSTHWDEPNVLAHVRTNDREIPGVGKSLHVEEIQSDWHQKGRSSGYQTNKTPTADDVELKFIKGNPPADAVDKSVYPGYWESIDKSDGSMIGRHRGDMTEVEALAQAIGDLKHKARNTGVPDAPFKSTWADVALKRQIREAAEKGYDAISWTPGEAQAARYDLSKQVHQLSLTHNRDGAGELIMIGTDGRSQSIPIKSRENLADTVGKDLAEKLYEQGAQNNGKARLSGLDLKVGGEGMRAFYDKMLVDKANAIGKKHGARVEQSEVKTSGGKPTDYADYDAWVASKNQPVHVLRITPELRAAAMKGFPLFTAGALVAGGTIGELARQDKYGRNE
jgi:hypothetical protein